MEQLEALLRAITVNAHSSVRIEAAGKTLYIDPFKLETAPHDADVIFLTHDHFDHYSPEDVEKVMKPGTVFVMPKSTADAAAQQTAGHRVVVSAPGQSDTVEGLDFEAVPAYNPGKPFHPQKNAWVGYVLNVLGLRVYIAGDTDATEEAAAVRCDVALLPIGGKYTMDPEEAAGLANRIRPQVVIPIHYGSVTGSPADFERFCAAAGEGLRVKRAF